MNFLSWILFGLLIGFIAHAITPRASRDSLTGAIVLGILGAFVGGFLGNIILGIQIEEFNLPSFIVAVLGATFIVFASKAAKRF